MAKKSKPSLLRLAIYTSLFILVLGARAYFRIDTTLSFLLTVAFAWLVLQEAWGLLKPLRGWNSRPLTTLRSRLPYNRLLLLFVLGFELFLVQLAYVISIAYPLAGNIVFNVVSLLITVQGLLLGLLGVSAFSGLGQSTSRTKYLAVLTIFSILFSFATVMLAELVAQLVPWVLPTFFLAAVGLFAIVVAVYSWVVVEARVAQTGQG